MSPTSNPIVKLAGVEYELKYGVLADLKASEMEITPSMLLQDAAKKNPRFFADYLKLFSAMVSHHFTRQHMPIPTPEYWAEIIEAEAPGDRNAQVALCGEIADKVVQVLFPNWHAAAIQAREVANTETTEQPPLTN